MVEVIFCIIFIFELLVMTDWSSRTDINILCSLVALYLIRWSTQAAVYLSSNESENLLSNRELLRSC